MRLNSRLIIASNRLPFTVQNRDGRCSLAPTCGGLAAALAPVQQRGDNVWVGWPGTCDALDTSRRTELDACLRRKRVAPVHLTQGEVAEYYDGVCNGVLWPVLHYLIDRLPITLPDFQSYREVNERFARAVVREYHAGDVIWIHDYQLLLAPAMVRARLPEAQIGFFLHTPFPAADVFRVLPWRRELLDGMLGASLLGFQTRRDARSFADAVSFLAGYRTVDDTVVTRTRRVRFGAYPIGLDPARLEPRAEFGERTEAGTEEALGGGRRVLLGVDRLDYTKGIPRRLAAYERLLNDNPALLGQVELLQVAVPSRAHVPSYAALQQEVHGRVASINGRFGTTRWTPVRYILRGLSPAEVAQLYAAADVMLVTSLRDGMNLVAKEYVLARKDEDGVLVLSELAGASEELREALLVNPYSNEQLAAAMATALAMDPAERRRRMRALRQRVAAGTVDAWVGAFLDDLARTALPDVAAGRSAYQVPATAEPYVSMTALGGRSAGSVRVAPLGASTT